MLSGLRFSVPRKRSYRATGEPTVKNDMRFFEATLLQDRARKHRGYF